MIKNAQDDYMYSNDCCYIDINFITETDDAICFTIDDDTFTKEAERIWAPKSQCRLVENNKVLEIPEWLALEKDLL